MVFSAAYIALIHLMILQEKKKKVPFPYSMLIFQTKLETKHSGLHFLSISLSKFHYILKLFLYYHFLLKALRILIKCRARIP